jgi:hypothetical protein
VHAKRIARLESRCVFFNLCLLDNIQSIHFSFRPEVSRSLLTFTIFSCQ